MMSPPPRRNDRGRSGRERRSAEWASGPAPNDMTVAEVTRPTSCCQLGNGSSMIRLTMNVMIVATHGTPVLVSAATLFGALPLLDIV